MGGEPKGDFGVKTISVVEVTPNITLLACLGTESQVPIYTDRDSFHALEGL